MNNPTQTSRPPSSCRFILKGREVYADDRVLVKYFAGGTGHCSVSEALASLSGHLYEGLFTEEWATTQFEKTGYSRSPHASYMLLPDDIVSDDEATAVLAEQTVCGKAVANG